MQAAFESGRRHELHNASETLKWIAEGKLTVEQAQEMVRNQRLSALDRQRESKRVWDERWRGRE